MVVHRRQIYGSAWWSLVLKVLYERPGETVDSPYYWKREYELYRSQMLATLPQTSLTTPIIYDCVEFPDACWIWMEDIPADRHAWDWTDYRLVARRLGRFNGAYLTGHPIPDYPWLSDQWHCRIVPPLADVFDHLDDYLKHPLAQRVLPVSEKAASGWLLIVLSHWETKRRRVSGKALQRRPSERGKGEPLFCAWRAMGVQCVRMQHARTQRARAG